MATPNETIDALASLTTKLHVTQQHTDVERVVEVTGDSLDVFSETAMDARILASKGGNTSFLKKVFSRKWKFKDLWMVRYLANDPTSTFFGVSFSSPTDLQRVLQRDPWCFTGGLLLGVSWPTPIIGKKVSSEISSGMETVFRSPEKSKDLDKEVPSLEKRKSKIIFYFEKSNPSKMGGLIDAKDLNRDLLNLTKKQTLFQNSGDHGKTQVPLVHLSHKIQYLMADMFFRGDPHHFVSKNPCNSSLINNPTTKLQAAPTIHSEGVVEVTGDSPAQNIEVRSLDAFSESTMVAHVYYRKGCRSSSLKKIFSCMWKFKDKQWKVDDHELTPFIVPEARSKNANGNKPKGNDPKRPLPTLQNLAEPEAGPAMQACLNQ